MRKNDTQDNAHVEECKSVSASIVESEMANGSEIQPNINSDVITYTAPISLEYKTAYKTQLTGKLKVAEIVQDIVVVMVSRLVSYPDSYIDIFINYLLAIGASGIFISGLIFFLNSSGIMDLYFKAYKNFWIGVEFMYCILWLVQFLVIPSLILGFTYSVKDYDETIYTESYEKNLIFMVVIAYLSTVVYAWDLWANFKVLRNQYNRQMLNPTSSNTS